MELKQIDNQTEWDSGPVTAGKHQSFLQSFEWGEILRAEGKEVERLAVLEKGKMLMQAQLNYYRLPLGWSYALCAKGPVFGDIESSQITEAYTLLSDYLKKMGCLFLRVEPREGKNFPEHYLVKRSKDKNPRATLLLDLKNTEEELLKTMHPKTRYNIRLAEKKDLRLSKEKDFDLFWGLMEITAKRDGFSLHEKKHYQEVFLSPFSRQITAFLGDKAIATSILAGFGDTMTYLYGASDNAHRNYMAPYLLQWSGITQAKKTGYAYYDFFGVAVTPLENQTEETIFPSLNYTYSPNDHYAGFTRFKLGFGGFVFQQPGTFDLIISPFKYRMYEVLRRVRRMV